MSGRASATPPKTPAAARQRAYRQRRIGGKIVVRVTIDEVEATEALKAAGLLSDDDAEDPEKIGRALERAPREDHSGRVTRNATIENQLVDSRDHRGDRST